MGSETHGENDQSLSSTFDKKDNDTLNEDFEKLSSMLQLTELDSNIAKDTTQKNVNDKDVENSKPRPKEQNDTQLKQKIKETAQSIIKKLQERAANAEEENDKNGNFLSHDDSNDDKDDNLNESMGGHMITRL